MPSPLRSGVVFPKALATMTKFTDKNQDIVFQNSFIVFLIACKSILLVLLVSFLVQDYHPISRCVRHTLVVFF